ncbi:putative disease resistance RPP13-like protein 1 [Vicia villosa]|uniref:putative disease resistance RPP13-like protein 1 n=1 Tax=Vicia villosa TaxID=3911 RepID=UPI00273B1F9B|nr:putative disease resistance RPP13-like protein 1 [Vicia villosa]
MATIVGGALLSASMEMLVGKIVSGEFVTLFRRTNLDVDLLEKLEITLLSLQSVLYDAEDKQIANPAIKKWLEMLQDVVFEADKLFDELNTEALRCQAEAGQVLNKFLSYFKRFNKKINSKLHKLFEKIEHLRKQKLGLKECDSNNVWNVTPTTSILGDESAICGRTDEREKLKEFLLSEEGCDSGNKIGVISIVGMGGLGKTTLVKLLYNDDDVKEKFEVRGWTHIPKDLDIFTVTKTILESVTSRTITDTNLDKLQVQLQQTLSNTKFLLVLDDIWHGKYVGWNSLNDIFNVGHKGSKIIITTRDERVVLPMQKFLYVHHLRSLETEDSWSLLARHAFVERNCQQHSNLETIGREIVKKCGGLPLPVVTLGGILRSKLSPDHWSDVLNSSIWEQTNDEVQPSLLLSYRYLPAPLKGCFAYCSVFPKNSILVKKIVIQLWIAEGLIPQPQSDKSWEKVAEKYFDELVSRSLIRQHSIDDESKGFISDEKLCFEMHDLINDLAMTVSSPYCTRLDNHKASEKVDKRVRHLSYNRSVYDSEDKFEKFHGLKGLQTFVPMPLHFLWHYDNFGLSKLFFDILSTMTQLRVLSLSNYKNITELPNSIGNLICLRYLNLSRTHIKRLPSETCKLYNLQTLLLSRCEELTDLPKDMGKLVKLRHLDIRDTKLKKMPTQISKLKNLQTLSDFIVSNVKDGGLKIEDLGKYPHLSGSLCISQLENVTDPFLASQANLEMKKEIDKLKLGWSYPAPSNSPIQSAVLERLRPSTNLKRLILSGYSGDKLPSWLGDPLIGCLNSLQKMTLENISSLTSFPSNSFPKTLQSLKIKGCDSLPSFTLCSLPVLKSLIIRSCKHLKSLIIAEDALKQNLLFLRTIDIYDCNELESVSLNGFPIPNLSYLSLWNCEKLCSLPESIKTLTSLQKMEIIDLPNLQSFSIDDIPINLRELSVSEVGGILWNKTWKHLTSLSVLLLLSDDIVKAMMKTKVSFLPTKLVSLRIYGLEDIECLDGKWLQHLTSLHTLEIYDAPKLKSLPDQGELPSSLKVLHIYKCPLLEANLQRKQGKEWSKISHIP